MYLHRIVGTLIFIILLILASCAQVSRRMPGELRDMHEFLTRDNPDNCRQYHYNFERQAPRLYAEQKPDSLLDVIDYIRTECGPAYNLEISRILLLADIGKFGDSLIGPATVPQMLWYRSEQERLIQWAQWNTLYGMSQPVDNTHDNFNEFVSELGEKLADDKSVGDEGHVMGLFYSGSYDSAFGIIQTDAFKKTAIRKSYNEYVSDIISKYGTRGNIALYIGSWRPQGNNEILGNHPEIGVQLGGEGNLFRADAVLAYRFMNTKNEYIVDSLGQLVSTNRFTSWMLGAEAGIKLFDNRILSTDIFIGLGYDAIYSARTDKNEDDFITHSSLSGSVGLRQRFFIDQKKGLYLGTIVKYNTVGYGNPGGTDLSGNTLTLSLVCGWSFNETLNQFLDKLNYKGSRRP